MTATATHSVSITIERRELPPIPVCHLGD